jgi:hypothetical protein
MTLGEFLSPTTTLATINSTHLYSLVYEERRSHKPVLLPPNQCILGSLPDHCKVADGPITLHMVVSKELDVVVMKPEKRKEVQKVTNFLL